MAKYQVSIVIVLLLHEYVLVLVCTCLRAVQFEIHVNFTPKLVMKAQKGSICVALFFL